jgi:hypothetical protein
VCRRGYPLLWCLPSVDGGSGNVCDFARDGGSNCNAGGINESIACRSLYCVHGICADRTPDGSLVCQPAEPPCPSGTLCSPGTATLPTSCQPPLAAGGPCDPPGTCVAGYWCAQHGDAAACDPLPAANAPCSGPCAAGLTCSRFQDAGACQTVVTDGGACRGLHDDTCAPGLVCVTTTNVCAPPAALGAACASDFDCQLGLYCDSPSQACRTWKRHGDSCTRDGECVYNGPCDAGHCNSVCIVPG